LVVESGVYSQECILDFTAKITFAPPAGAFLMKTDLRKGMWLIFQNRVWAERWRHRGGQETAGGDPGRVLLLFFLIGGATAELPCAAKLWPGENKRAPRACSWCSPQADITTQLAVEQAEMIRGKRLRPLATVSDKPLEIEGFGTIEPISKTLPGFKSAANYFGIFIPKGVPAEVVATVEKIWADQIMQNEAIKKYAVNRGAFFGPSSGEAAQANAFPAVQANAWLLHSGGKTKVAPDTVGIPKP